MKIDKVRISQKTLPVSAFDPLYSTLEGQKVILKRIFDPRFSVSGDDLIIEGELDNFVDKITRMALKMVAVRFTEVDESIEKLLEQMACFNLETEKLKVFFGTAMVSYEEIGERIRIKEKEKILALMFRTQLGAYFTALMPVKIKGIIIVNKEKKTIEFILPVQNVNTLKEWIKTLTRNQSVDFDTIVDIYRVTDPAQRKKMEQTIQWINTHLPELIAKAAIVEELDVTKIYAPTLRLL